MEQPPTPDSVVELDLDDTHEPVPVLRGMAEPPVEEETVDLSLPSIPSPDPRP